MDFMGVIKPELKVIKTGIYTTLVVYTTSVTDGRMYRLQRVQGGPKGNYEYKTKEHKLFPRHEPSAASPSHHGHGMLHWVVQVRRQNS